MPGPGGRRLPWTVPNITEGTDCPGNRTTALNGVGVNLRKPKRGPRGWKLEPRDGNGTRRRVRSARATVKMITDLRHLRRLHPEAETAQSSCSELYPRLCEAVFAACDHEFGQARGEDQRRQREFEQAASPTRTARPCRISVGIRKIPWGGRRGHGIKPPSTALRYETAPCRERVT